VDLGERFKKKSPALAPLKERGLNREKGRGQRKVSGASGGKGIYAGLTGDLKMEREDRSGGGCGEKTSL